MKFLPLALAAAALSTTVLAAGPTDSEAKPDTILPGYWESVHTLPFPLGKKTERRCIQQRDIDKFMKGPSNHIYTCVYPMSTARDGVVAFRGECSSRKGRRLWIKGEGTYTPTTLKMKVNVKSRLAGIMVSGTASTNGRRIGDVCPPGSPGSGPPEASSD